MKLDFMQKSAIFSSLVYLIFWILFVSPAQAANHVETLEFEGSKGEKLRSVLAFPEGKSPERLFVFIKGEGNGCTAFPLETATLQAQHMNLQDAFIFPETARDALCESGDYKHLDFFHRATEVENLVRAISKDSRFARVDTYLLAHSGGPQVAARAASRTKVRGLILIEGVSSGYEQMTYQKILSDGYAAGDSADEIELRLSQMKEIFGKVKLNCSTQLNDWGDRSNKFWCEMFLPSLGTDLLTTDKDTKLFLIHGLKDDVVPITETYSLYSSLIASRRAVNLKVYPMMGHNINMPEIISDVSQWARQLEQVAKQK